MEWATLQHLDVRHVGRSSKPLQPHAATFHPTQAIVAAAVGTHIIGRLISSRIFDNFLRSVLNRRLIFAKIILLKFQNSMRVLEARSRPLILVLLLFVWLIVLPPAIPSLLYSRLALDSTSQLEKLCSSSRIVVLVACSFDYWFLSEIVPLFIMCYVLFLVLNAMFF